MKFFTSMSLLFYVVTIFAMGTLIVLFSYFIDANLIGQISEYLNILRVDLQLRWILAIAGLFFMLLSFQCAMIISGAKQKERTIAFDNPSGRVTISLFAMEDMVKNLVLREPEVREVRANMIATKKGLDIEARLSLKADVNIPDLTARMQEMIKTKIQDMIGIEEAVVVRMHVMKIAIDENKIKRSKTDFPEKPEPAAIPFQGYRA